MLKKNLLFSLLLVTSLSYAQRGKNGALVVSTSNTVVNAYTALSANVTLPTASITVISNGLTNATNLSTPLAAGDLVMIYQAQGAAIDVDQTPTVSWGANYTLSSGAMADIGNWTTYHAQWGSVTNYNNAGKYEVLEVASVSGSNTITFTCNLQNAYTVAGKTQLIRLPRLTSLTINPNQSVSAATWNGSTGGVVALEVNGNIDIQSNAKVTATAAGFRGGIADVTSNGSTSTGAQGFPGSFQSGEGNEKGESIAGFTTEYIALSSRFGKSSPANGGGGGNNHNAGGGGGSNVGAGTYTGKGIPQSGGSFATCWNLEGPGFATSSSSGGGRGGYTGTTNNADELTVGPAQGAWGGDFRRNEGGLGGHTLIQNNSRLFFGGGGGAGEGNNNSSGVIQAGNGGVGGGIVFIRCYGSIIGTGKIESNGSDGSKTNPTNIVPGAFSSTLVGDDGAGGAGAGGAIVISNGTALVSSLVLEAKGGKGGDNQMAIGGLGGTIMRAHGPGGGGAGGQISLSSGSPTQIVTGGLSGVVTPANAVSNFNVNGATMGASGISGITQNYYNLTPNNAVICSSSSANLTVNVVGTIPAGSSVTWYTSQFGSTSVGSGTSYTTPVLSANATYYVGVCPGGSFRIPVTVTVGGPSISGMVSITSATCSSGGSISGLTAAGVGLSYTWNGTSSVGPSLSGASAGSYTLVVTDGAGCQVSSGPHAVPGVGGPSINTTAIVLNNPNCLGNNGSISGITASGLGLTYSWTSGASSVLNPNGLSDGSYSLTVTDVNSCFASAGPFVLTSIPGPSINGSVSIINSTCGSPNGSISGLSSSGASSFSWNSGFSTDLNPGSLLAGTYNLVASNALGCTANYGPINITTTSIPLINAASIILTDDHCFQNTADISGIVVSSGTPTYTYSWNAGAYNTLNLTNVASGNYTLVVSDALGCQSTSSVFNLANIAGPNINVSGLSITNQSCLGNDGAISGITVTGSGALTYSWNLAPASGPSLSGLNAGTFVLGVQDAFGCNAVSSPINVIASAGPTIDATSVLIANPSCLNNDGGITGISAAGTGLTFSWNSTPEQTNLNATNLPTGAYSLTVTDNSGCSVSSGPYPMLAVSPPVFDATSVVIENAICGLNNGEISGLIPSELGLTYELNNVSIANIDQTSLAPGTYTIEGINALGCSAVYGPIDILNEAGPTLVVGAISSDHCAQGIGAINTTITLGATPVSISWNSGAYITEDLSGLFAGNYNVVVTDVNGCQASDNILITNVSGPSINESGVVIFDETCLTNDGSITGILFSGTGALTYLWNDPNASTTSSISSLSAGSFAVTVSDLFGCSLTSSNFTVNGSTPITINASTLIISSDHCGQNIGGINGLTISGGTSPYNIVWDANPGLNTLSINNQFGAGTHEVVVTDNFDCNDSYQFIINNISGPSIDLSSMVVTNATCDLANGSITGITASGEPGLIYSWFANQSQTTSSINLISSGDYALTVTDSYGCFTNTLPISVLNEGLVNADFTASTFSGSINEAIYFTDNSSGNVVTYSWDIDTSVSYSSSTTCNYSFPNVGSYVINLTVISDKGCLDSIQKIVEITSELEFPNVITINNDMINDAFFIKNLKPNSKFIVQNRWGQVVFETNDYKNDWKGLDIFKGEVVVEGVYFYQLIDENNKLHHGNMQILR